MDYEIIYLSLIRRADIYNVNIDIKQNNFIYQIYNNWYINWNKFLWTKKIIVRLYVSEGDEEEEEEEELQRAFSRQSEGKKYLERYK